VLVFGTQVHGLAPSRSRRIFRAKNILSTPSFGWEVKPSVPCRSFTACKRSQNVTRKSEFRQNFGTFLAHSFGGLEVACWPSVRGFAPGRSRRIIRAKKILSTPSFGGELKPSVLCRSFTACKRSQNVTSKSEFRQNFRTFLAQSSTFRRWVFSRDDTRGDAWWRKLERLTKIAQ